MSNLQAFDLTGKRAIVTGGSRGLGRGSAEGLLEAGASVVIIGSSKAVHDTAEAFREKGYDCRGLQMDLRDRQSRREAFVESVKQLGGLDILVQAAGVQARYPSPDFPLDEWDRVLEVNLTAVFDLSQMAIREFMKKPWKVGEPSIGKIVHYSSELAFFGGFTVPAYAASKGGVSQITKALCNENACRGININAVVPGYMMTAMNAAFFDDPSYAERTKNITGRIPAGRWGEEQDMKGITVFLSSHASDYLNGTIIPVDGGYQVK